MSWLSVGLSAQTRDVYSVEDVPNVQLIDSTRFVSDPNDAIPDDDEAALNRRLGQLRDSLSVEIAIVVIPAYDVEKYSSAREFANELFNTWGIGDKETNRGLLIQLVTREDLREITFETGYGLEGELPDGLCMLIQKRRMIPRGLCLLHLVGARAARVRWDAPQTVACRPDGQRLLRVQADRLGA